MPVKKSFFLLPLYLLLFTFVNHSIQPLAAGNSPVQLDKNNNPLYFQQISAAFEYQGLADDDQIKLQARTFNEDLNFDKDLALFIKGGLDSNFQANSGYTTVNGSFTIQGGNITLENLILGPGSNGATSYPQPVILNFQASSESISTSETVTLSWETTGASQAEIDNAVGSVTVSGKKVLTPTVDTTYTLTATGPGGSDTKTLTVTVDTPPPTASLEAQPNKIEAGQNVLLNWISTHATSCSLTPIGAVSCSGYHVDTPSQTTTYTLTATGPEGQVSEQLTVTVGEAPDALILSGCPSSPINSFAEYPLTATLDYPTEQDREVTQYTRGTSYHSSDARVARVSPSGRITPVSDGVTTITARNTNLTDTCTLTVNLPDDTITGLKVTPWNPVLSTLYSTANLTVFGVAADGTETDVTASTEFTTFNDAIAAVSDTGTVTAMGNGVTQIQMDFNGVSLNAPVTVLIAGPPSSGPLSGYINGKVTEPDGIPISGAQITMDGAVGLVETDAEGKFAFPTPDSDQQFRITAEKTGYTYAHRTGGVMAGHDTVIDTIVLTPLDAAQTTITDNSVENTHTSSDGSVEIVVPPYATSSGVTISVTNLTDNSMIPKLPDTSVFTYCVKLEPDLWIFDRPVKIRIQNALNFPPGTWIPAGRYSRDTGQWEHIGMAIVSDDGNWVEAETDRFSAVDYNSIESLLSSVYKKLRKNRFIEDSPLEDLDTNELCTGLGGGSLVTQMTGNLLEKHNLPAYRSRSLSRNVQLAYNSDRAKPRFPLSANSPAGLADTDSIRAVGAAFSVEGVKKEFYFKPTEEICRFGWFWDGLNGRENPLDTGVYPYSIEFTYFLDAFFYLQENFGGFITIPTTLPSTVRETLTKTSTGHAVIVNFSDSPYGAGWGIQGLQKLEVGYAMVKPMIYDGGGAVTTFSKQGIVVPQDIEYPSAVTAGDLPPFVIPDGKGGFYFSNPEGNVVMHSDTTGKAIRIAGADDGTSGDTGDGERALNALLNDPGKLLLDSMGNLYICDRGNNRIRRVDTNGIMVAISGGGTTDSDGIPADEAVLSNPSALAMDEHGNLYVAEQGSHRVRMIARDGIISTVAGTGTAGYSGDGGQATAAQLDSPNALAIDGLGRLYISDSENFRIRRIEADGTIETVAGNGINMSTGNGGKATEASLRPVSDIAIGHDGSLFALTRYSYDRIRIITPEGFIDELLNLDDEYPHEPGETIAIGPDNNLYMGGKAGGGYDPASHQILKVVSGGAPVGTWTLYGSAGDFSTLSRKGDGTYERRYPNGTVIAFDANGRQTSIADNNQNATTFSYTPLGTVETITDPTGKPTIFSYAAGKLSQITDPMGRITGISIDSNGDLVQITNPDTTTRQFAYDQDHRMLSHTDSGGATTTYRYETLGGVDKVTYEDNSTREIKSEFSQAMVNLLSAGTGTKDNLADPFIVKDMENSFADASGRKQAFEVNRFGIRDKFMDSLNRESQIDRSQNNLPSKIESAEGRVHEITYNTYGLPASTHNLQNGADLTISYKDDFAGASDLVLPEQIVNPRGEITSYLYDSNGNVTQTTDAALKIWTYTYDPVWTGLLETMTNPENETTTFSYDSNGNVSTVTNHLNQTTTFEYDPYGNLEKRIDPEAKEILYTYDNMNRVTQITDPLLNTVQFDWDPAYGSEVPIGSAPMSVLKIYTDKRGKTKTYDYDQRYRLTSVTDHAGRQVTYTYDGEGRIITMTDENDRITRNEYGPAGQLIKISYDDGSVVSRNYDADGLLREIFEDTNGIIFEYDDTGRRTDATFWVNSGIPNHIMSFEYDLLDRRTGMTSSTGLDVTYEYIPTNLLTKVSAGGGTDVTFEYDGARRRVKRTYPNGIFRDIAYDDAERMVSIDMQNTGGSIETIQYGYDDAGRVESITDIAGLHDYTFDNMGQLKTAQHPNPLLNPDESYSYDAIGNRTASHLSASYIVDDLNRLTEDSTFTYTYDNHGNLLTRVAKSGGATTTYTYDARNRLTNVELDDGTTISYTYDVLNRRMAVSENGVTLKRFRYDDLDRIAELDATGAVSANFVFDLGLDNPLIMFRNTDPYFFHGDRLKTVRMITDVSQTITNQYQYDSFGQIVDAIETVENPFTFTGRPLDTSTGLYYFRARDYDPVLGRFISPDLPVFSKTGNLYTYTENRPLDLLDPLGYIVIGIGLEGSGTWAPLISAFAKSYGFGVLLGSQGKNICLSSYETNAAYAGFGEGGALNGSIALHVSPFGDLEHFNGKSHNLLVTGQFLEGASLNFAYPDLGADASWGDQFNAVLNGTISFSGGVGPGAVGAGMYGESQTSVSPVNAPKSHQQVNREIFMP